MRNSAAASVTITTRTSFKRLGAKGEILIHLVCSKDHSKYFIKQYLRAKVITNQRCVFKEVLSNQLLVVFDHFLLPCFTPPLFGIMLFGLTLFGPNSQLFVPTNVLSRYVYKFVCDMQSILGQVKTSHFNDLSFPNLF